MKKLYIHIGTPKTGTTSLQTFCSKNQELLNSKGYVFPPCPYSYPGVSRERNNGRFLVGSIRDDDRQRNDEAEKHVFLEGMEKIKELFHKYNAVILSDEGIWRTMDVQKRNLWKDLKQEADAGGYEVKVIVYLRRQDKFISSLWIQNIKKLRGTNNLGEERFEDYLDKINKESRLDYYAKLERIAAVFGKEHIIVRRFEKGSFYGESIYFDFLYAIGITDANDFSIPDITQNHGLYGNTHEIKRILNGLPQMQEIGNQNFFREVLAKCSELSKKNYPCEMFSKEEAQKFMAEYEEGNQRIVKEYLNENETALFHEEFKNVAKWEPDNPYMHEDIIRFIGICSICLANENDELRQEIKKFRQELNSIKHPIWSISVKILKKIKNLM